MSERRGGGDRGNKTSYGGKRPHGNIPKHQNMKGSNNDNVRASPKSGKTSRGHGPISELPYLEYKFRRQPDVFDQAKQKFADYVGRTIGGRSNHIFKHMEEYEFPPVPEPEPEELNDENDPHGLRFNEIKELRRAHIKKVITYNDNKEIVYSIIWGQCAESLRNKIVEADDYEEFDRRRNGSTEAVEANSRYLSYQRGDIQ
jgi:hypothetical protein